MLIIVCFGDLWVDKVSISLKIKIKKVQLYRFGIKGLKLNKQRYNFYFVEMYYDL